MEASVIILAVLIGLLLWSAPCLAQEAAVFDIRFFDVEGSTLLPDESLVAILQPFLGERKTAADIEKARSALEKSYHEGGYPAVMVNIPEQTIEKEGIVLLQVIESTIGSLRITGNEWSTQEKLARDFPSLAPGKVLYVPDIQKDLTRAGRSEDFKAAPLLAPGKLPGTTDVELKVEEKAPFHGSLELNNRNTHETSDLRLLATARYDNLWQRNHSFGVQYQVSPTDTSEVEVYGGSYSLPAPWNLDHRIALYAMRSDSNTAVSGSGLLVTGKGTVVGGRYNIPLPALGAYGHSLALGVDYKDFDETTGFSTGENTRTPITYTPFSAAYSSVLPDSWGLTKFDMSLNAAFRDIVSGVDDFDQKRYLARGNYVYFLGSVEREQKLPKGIGLFLKLDGQWSDQPLVSNEQFVAGGAASVRGYMEAEALGDMGFHGTLELFMPMAGRFGLSDAFDITPYAFFDYAWLRVLEPLPGQREAFRLEGAGAGLRGRFGSKVYYDAALAFPLLGTNQTEPYRQRLHFKVGVQF